MRYALRYWKWLFVGLAAMGGGLYTRLIVPRLTQRAIDAGILGKDSNVLLLSTGLILLMAFAGGVIRFAERYSMEYMCQRVIYDIRNRLYDHLQQLSFSFYDDAHTGQLMSRVTADVETLRRFLARGLIGLIENTLLLVSVVIILLRYHVGLALASLATLPFLTYAVVQFGQKVRPAYRDIQVQVASMTAVLQENITGVRVVRAFAREDREEEKFEVENKLYQGKQITAVRLHAYYTQFMTFLSNLGVAVVLLYGGRLVIDKTLTIGILVAFTSYLTQLMMPLRMFGMIVSLSQRAIASGQRVFELLDAAPEIKDEPGAVELPPIRGHVELRQVSFGYGGGDEPEVLVLRDVDLEVLPGRTVALLGATGSGKSSIINLIPRFYDPTSGQVLVDGNDVKHVTLQSLRRQIGIVLQETFLFSASIRENIAYGKTGATQEEVESAAKAAHIHDFIVSLPDGYETEIGERGVGLSGGQKQRVAIARALLMDPRILILDDSTSSVDTETEYQIQQALANLMRGRTTIVIAQRLSTIKNADEIVVLDQGRIVERGRHEDLLDKSRIYTEIYNLQLRRQEDASGQEPPGPIPAAQARQEGGEA
jgi:ATP-binding cassette subfamily B protein